MKTSKLLPSTNNHKSVFAHVLGLNKLTAVSGGGWNDALFFQLPANDRYKQYIKYEKLYEARDAFISRLKTAEPDKLPDLINRGVDDMGLINFPLHQRPQHPCEPSFNVAERLFDAGADCIDRITLRSLQLLSPRLNFVKSSSSESNGSDKVKLYVERLLVKGYIPPDMEYKWLSQVSSPNNNNAYDEYYDKTGYMGYFVASRQRRYESWRKITEYTKLAYLDALYRSIGRMEEKCADGTSNVWIANRLATADLGYGYLIKRFDQRVIEKCISTCDLRELALYCKYIWAKEPAYFIRLRNEMDLVNRSRRLVREALLRDVPNAELLLHFTQLAPLGLSVPHFWDAVNLKAFTYLVEVGRVAEGLELYNNIKPSRKEPIPEPLMRKILRECTASDSIYSKDPSFIRAVLRYIMQKGVNAVLKNDVDGDMRRQLTKMVDQEASRRRSELEILLHYIENGFTNEKALLKVILELAHNNVTVKGGGHINNSNDYHNNNDDVTKMKLREKYAEMFRSKYGETVRFQEVDALVHFYTTNDYFPVVSMYERLVNNQEEGIRPSMHLLLAYFHQMLDGLAFSPGPEQDLKKVELFILDQKERKTSFYYLTKLVTRLMEHNASRKISHFDSILQNFNANELYWSYVMVTGLRCAARVNDAQKIEHYFEQVMKQPLFPTNKHETILGLMEAGKLKEAILVSDLVKKKWDEQKMSLKLMNVPHHRLFEDQKRDFEPDLHIVDKRWIEKDSETLDAIAKVDQMAALIQGETIQPLEVCDLTEEIEI